MNMMTKKNIKLSSLLMLLFLFGQVVAEEFSVIFSGTVQGETEPCG